MIWFSCEHLSFQFVAETCDFSLTRHGADVTVQDIGELTPLHVAVMGRHRTTAELLISLGADPHAADPSGCTPVVLAIALSMPEVYRLSREVPGP